MKSKKLYFLLMLVALASCSEDVMDDINKNVNDPNQVASKFILTDVMTSTAFSVTGADYAFYSSVYMELNVGVWGQMYNAETRVAEPISATTYNNSWNSQYRNLYNLQIVIDKCASGDEKGNWLNLGIARVLSAYNWALLTDLMGDVPYAEAMKAGVIFQPKVDKQEIVYQNVTTLLDSAIANLGKTSTYASLGNQDLIYKGDKAKWLKAAQGLKARYAMRMSFKNANYDAVIAAANTSFVNAADELKYVYNGTTSVNPFSRFLQDRDYFGASASLNAKLVERADPRAARFFKVYPIAGATLLFAPNGKPEQAQKKYAISNISSITAPTYLMSYHELQFLKAEAYVRKGGAANITLAETELKKAIQAAFVKVGLTTAAADTYYTASVKALFDANPLKEVMVQKYLSAYEDEGVEAYNDYRRLMAMGNGSLINLSNTGQFPLRFTYGSSDVTTNVNVRDAYGDGSYVYTEKVWWAGGTR